MDRKIIRAACLVLAAVLPARAAEVLMETPAIASGIVVEDAYYTGPVDIAVSYEDLGGIQKQAEYSLDGIDWFPADPPEFFKIFPTADRFENVVVPSTGAEGWILHLWQNGGGAPAGAGIYAQPYDKEGNPRNDPFRINESTHVHPMGPILGAAAVQEAEAAYVVYVSLQAEFERTEREYAEASAEAGRIDNKIHELQATLESEQRYLDQSCGPFSCGPYSEVCYHCDDLAKYINDLQDAIRGEYSKLHPANIRRDELNGVLILKETNRNVARFSWDEKARIAKEASREPRPAAVTVSSETFLAAWTFLSSTTVQTDIHARVAVVDGSLPGEEFRVNVSTGGQRRDPALAISSGTILIVWTARGPAVGEEGIFGRVFDTGGLALSDEFRISISTSSSLEGPRVAVLNGGRFVVVWTGWGEEGRDIFARVLEPDGQMAGGEISVNDYRFDDQRAPSIAALPDGGFMVAWHNAQGDGRGTGVFSRRFDAAGAPVDGDLRWDSGPEGADWNPVLAGLPLEGLLGAWNARVDVSTSGVVRRWRGSGLGDLSAVIDGEVTGFQTIVSSGRAEGFVVTGRTEEGETVHMVPFRRVLAASNLSPDRDIAIQFRLTDPSTGETVYSPVRDYVYVSDTDGAGGGISYADGTTNQDRAAVTISTPACATCGRLSFSLFSRDAPLSGGACGPFDEWFPAGAGSAAALENVVGGLQDGRCYQFKAEAVNLIGRLFDYQSPAVLKVDRTAPVISVLSQTRVEDLLTLQMAVADAAGEVEAREYAVNGGEAVSFSGTTLTVSLIDGLNRIAFSARDRAGNLGRLDHFVSVDLTPSEIRLHSPREGGVYGSDITLVYDFTSPLDNVEIRVDGLPHDGDLSILPDGPHQVLIRGTDDQGTLVFRQVNFTIDRTLFSVSLLSPQARLHEYNTINVQYSASEPLVESWYSLDGGPDQTAPALTGLADGDHALVFSGKRADGAIATDSVQFSVRNAIPSLEVSSPEAGRTYPVNEVEVLFGADGPVSFQIGGQSGNIASETTLTLGDGDHTLVLTATHPVSGSVVSRVIPFRVDALPLSLVLNSPSASVYPYGDIPVDYTANKPLASVDLFLDGSPISALTDLSPGEHAFRLIARDAAGREVERLVRFQVARLEILSPGEGEKVLSGGFPPSAPLLYEARGDFGRFSYRLDAGPSQLLTNPPGVPVSLRALPGDHRLTLRGEVGGGFSVARTRDFSLGAKDLVLGPDGLQYAFTGCVPGAMVSCGVSVSLRVWNKGDYDVDEPVLIRFDRITSDGVQSQWRALPALAAGEKADVALDPFTASIGDVFLVTVDPQGDIPGEWPEGNTRRVVFQPAQITGVTAQYAEGNSFIQGVSLTNILAVETAGNVSSVEARVGSWTFVDEDAGDGFQLLTDMGLLTPASPCVQILARDGSGLVGDARRVCYQVRPVDLAPLEPFLYNWAAFADGVDRRVVMNDVPARKALESRLYAKFDVLSRNSSVTSRGDAGRPGEVGYQLLFDAGAARRADPRAEEIGPVLFLVTLNPTNGVCSAAAANPLVRADRSGYFGPVRKNDADLIAGGVDPGASLEDLLRRPEAGGLLAGSELIPFMDRYGDSPFGEFADPGRHIKVRDGVLRSEFRKGDCVSYLTDSGEIRLLMAGRYQWDLRDAVVDVSRNIADPDTNAVSLDLRDITIPMDLKIGASMSLVDNRVHFGPARLHAGYNAFFGMRPVDARKNPSRLDELVAKWTPHSSVAEWTQFVSGGWSANTEYRAFEKLNTRGKTDWAIGASPDRETFEAQFGRVRVDDMPGREFDYSFFAYGLEVQRKREVCFWGWCGGQWKHFSGKAPPAEVLGRDYDEGDVEGFMGGLLPFDLGSIEDNVSLQLYFGLFADYIAEAADHVADKVTHATDPEFPTFNTRRPGPVLVADSDGNLRVETPNYLRDATLDNPSEIPPGGKLAAGRYQTWIWGGTSSWVVLNERDKEILIIDGYVSKLKSTPFTATVYVTGSQLDRIVRLANHLRRYVSDGYKIVGVIGTHNHWDHVADVGPLLTALTAKVADKFCQDSGERVVCSSLDLAGPPVDRNANRFPVIADKSTVTGVEDKDGKAQQTPGYRQDTFTHYLAFMEPSGKFLVNQDFAPKGTEYGAPFAGRAGVVKRETGIVYHCPDCTEGSFKLGRFEIQPYVWDHQDILGFGERRRTLALRFWHDAAENARRTFLTSSVGENQVYFSDRDRVLAEGGGRIWTDVLLYSWSNSDEIDIEGAQKKGASLVAKDLVRFYERPGEAGSTATVVANHHDPNGCDTFLGCGTNGDRADSMFDHFFQRNGAWRYDPVQDCNKWEGSVDRCVEHVKFKSRIGVEW